MIQQQAKEAEKKLTPLLEPRSIAVVGATDRPGPARNVVANLDELGFGGHLYLVNPKRTTIAGRPAIASLGDMDEPCDLMVAAVNREATVEVVAEAVELGVRAGVLLAAGFGESDSRGALLQERLAAVRSRIALIGPNCLGYVNLQARVAPYSGPPIRQPRVGNVALVSNSGALACTITGAAAERGLLFCHVITTGNQVGITTSDFVRYLSDRPEVGVIACYIEGFQDGRDLLAAFAEAKRNGKRLAVLKAGRTKAGGEAARTHTGALSGSSLLQESLFGDAGVLMAKDIEEFLAIVELQSLVGDDLHGDVGVLTISGGERLLMADASEEAGLRLASLSEKTGTELRSVLPPFAAVSNPLDTTGAGIVEGDIVVHAEAARVFAAEPAVSVLVACQDAKNGWLEAAGASQMFLDAVRTAHQAATSAAKPLVVVSPTSGSIDNRARRYMINNGIPFLAGLVPSVTALSKVLGHAVIRDESPELSARSEGQGRLTGSASFERLQAAGVATWPYRLVTDEDEAVAAAREFGFPVVAKLDAPVAHRNRLDGVRLGLRDEASVRLAFSELALISESLTDASGVLVQPTAPSGVELFIGGMKDSQFGPVLLLGMGGTAVEQVASFAAALAPFDEAAARGLLERAPLPATPEVLIDREGAPDLPGTLARLSRLVAAADVAALDVNPLIVHAAGIAIIDVKFVVGDVGAGSTHGRERTDRRVDHNQG